MDYIKNLNIILAATDNNLIGCCVLKNGEKVFNMPWGTSIKEDLKYFKQITEGNIVIMGYNTFLSINKKPLKNRRNIVLTNSHIDEVKKYGFEVISNIEKIQEIANSSTEKVFIIGGASLYSYFMDKVERIYMTRVKKYERLKNEILDYIFVRQININKYKLKTVTKLEKLNFEVWERK